MTTDHATPPRGERPFNESFDARDWATAFLETMQQNPSIATDHETMTGWFANAIMRGWDGATNHAALSAPPSERQEGTYRPGPLRYAFVKGMRAGGSALPRDEVMALAMASYPDVPVTEPRLVQSASGAPPSEPTREEIEALAPIVYAAMQAHPTDEHTPYPWAVGGNALAQDTARRAVRDILAALPASRATPAPDRDKSYAAGLEHGAELAMTQSGLLDAFKEHGVDNLDDLLESVRERATPPARADREEVLLSTLMLADEPETREFIAERMCVHAVDIDGLEAVSPETRDLLLTLADWVIRDRVDVRALAARARQAGEGER